MQLIGREEVQQLAGNGAALVEVLPQKAYERAHLPGAISLPLAGLYPFSAAKLSKDCNIAVYCYDSQ
ncbi:MAG TPA: rhodanese-like domain-containing protein [Candidatus Binatia bacterium]|jgi:rhodanese-related sulfurtransferase